MSQKRIKKRPNYIDKMLALCASKKILQGPGMHHIKVAHDDWCKMRQGTGECDCNPDVSYIATEGQN